MIAGAVLENALQELIAQKRALDAQSAALDKPIGVLRELLNGHSGAEKAPMNLVNTMLPREAEQLRRAVGGRPKNPPRVWKRPCPYAAQSQCIGGSNTDHGLRIHIGRAHRGVTLQRKAAVPEAPKKETAPVKAEKKSDAFEKAKLDMQSPANQRECVCKDHSNDSKNHVFGMHLSGGKCMMPNCQCPEFMERT